MNPEAGCANRAYLDFTTSRVEGEGDGAVLIRILSLVTCLITALSRKTNGLVHMPEILGWQKVQAWLDPGVHVGSLGVSIFPSVAS